MISEGFLSLMSDPIRAQLADVYATMRRANAHIASALSLPIHGPTGTSRSNALASAKRDMESVEPHLNEVRAVLLEELGHPLGET